MNKVIKDNTKDTYAYIIYNKTIFTINNSTADAFNRHIYVRQ